MTRVSLGRLWRTVRHLRTEQVLGRVWFRLHRPRPDLRSAPALRAAADAWVEPARREASLLGPQHFRFLNVEHTLGIGSVAWDDPAMERLWRYNLHYFDDLNALGANRREAEHRAVLDRWISENPPGQGTGWEPYPVSLRIVNWIKCFVAYGAASPAPVWLHSLAVQARYLYGRLEWHLLGNHLFVNAKALVFAGLYFDGEEAQAWLARGLAILARELPEQILADGGQFERSPMYHALALEDLLDLLNLITARAAVESSVRGLLPQLHATAASMLYWLRSMSHPDGTLAHFNDSADGIAPSNVELERYAAALGISAAMPQPGLEQLAASGYIRASRGGALLLLDVALLGPDYLVGHAHADTLSFELSLGARRLLVNGGTSCYGLSAQRLRERGTAAHNTVELDGQDSSEVWSGFRVGRRAHPLDLQVRDTHISCAHDGYRHLSGQPMHRRSWTLQEGVLLVRDEVAPADPVAVARYRLAPGLHLQAEGPAVWRVCAGTQVIARVEVQAGQARITASQHAPRFGVVVDTQTLELTLQTGVAITLWSWNPDAYPLSH